jgi:hypothetical protein
MERLRLTAIACVALIGLLAVWYGIEEASDFQRGPRSRAAPARALAASSRLAPASSARTVSLRAPSLSPSPSPGTAAAPQPISGGSCDPSRLPIQMIVVRNAQEVASSAGRWPDEPTLLRESETVVFSSGRIVTANVESTSALLNELGWASRRIEFLAAAGLSSQSKRLRRRG